MATTDAQLVIGCDAVAAAQDAVVVARQDLSAANGEAAASTTVVEAKTVALGVAQGNLRAAEIALRQLILAR